MGNLNSFGGFVSNKPIISGDKQPVEPPESDYISPYCFIVVVDEKNTEVTIEWSKVSGSVLTKIPDEFRIFFSIGNENWQPYSTLDCNPDQEGWKMVGPRPDAKPYRFAIRALKNGIYISDFNESCPN